MRALRYDVVLFDFDYTLVDASGCLLPALRTALQAIGVPPPAELVLRRLIGIPLERQFAALAPGRESAFASFRNAYVHARDTLEAAGTKLIPGADDALRSLSANGATIAIVSTGSPGRIIRSIERLRLAPYIDDVIGGAGDKGDALRRSSLKYGVDRCIYVGDRPDDGDAAQRAHMAFIGVCTGAFGFAEFGAAEAIVPSVRFVLQTLTAA